MTIWVAEQCVTFGPMAWGRALVEQLGVTCSPVYRLRCMSDGTVREMPLANEMVYAWAKAMLGLYRTPERNEVFRMVAFRSAEVDAVNKSLNAGASEADIRGSFLQPTLVHFRQVVTPAAMPPT
jgi:hypothetical protein